ncbi:unnamed protein product [Darwinula stevensoni]|uniref:Uncharacterized protein n=1 Tax=Darwinula stevensoni TaxID=69355 RepID=A0A7R9A8G6_9CRUS|nr:unnamed protein product [Darwinula stevensoni]CAG0896351.1 unnamed protein product [Darwinula stevensoni]
MGKSVGVRSGGQGPKVLSLFVLLAVGRRAGAQDLVMMVSFDGFRHDYFSVADTPNFDTLREDGVYVPKMKPIFTTLTFTNHHAIATGLYAETHMAIANALIDPETGEYHYLFEDGDGVLTKDPRIIPIWVVPCHFREV